MSLRLRLLLLIAVLLQSVLAGSLGFVHRDLSQQIHDNARLSLQVATAHFRLLEEQRREALEIAATALEQEPGFRNVLRTNDQATMLDYLQGVLEAYRLDLVLVLDAEGRLLVSSPAVPQPPAQAARGEAGTGYWQAEGRLYQVAWLPMEGAAERLVGAVVVGQVCDQRLVDRLAQDTGCQVTLQSVAGVLTSPGDRGEALTESLNLGGVGNLTLAKATREARDRVMNLTRWLLGLGFGAMAVAVAISYPLLGRISNPVEALARAEARLQAIVEANTDGLVALDPQGRVTLANPAAARALGREVEELPGLTLESLVDSETADQLLADPEGRLCQSAVFERERRRFVLTRTFLGRTTPGSLVVVRDVTQERAWEQRTADFFELLAAQLRAERGADFDRCLGNLAVLASGGLQGQPEPVELAPLLRELHPQAVVEGEPAQVLAHPASLRLALANLLDNARRYGAEPVQLGARRDGGATEIWVSDAGAGFEETRLAEVTDASYPKRGLHQGSQPSGLGIGLAVCRILLLESGTRLSHEGTRFSFWLPQAPP